MSIKKLLSLNNLLCIFLVLISIILSGILYVLHENRNDFEYKIDKFSEEELLNAKNLFSEHCYSCHKDISYFSIEKDEHYINKTIKHSKDLGLDINIFNERVIETIIEFLSIDKN